MYIAENWLSVEPDNCLIRVHVAAQERNYHETYEYLVFSEPSEPLWVLGQLATGRWMELDPKMQKCIKWIEKHLRWINRRHRTKFSIQPRRLGLTRPCQFGLVGG